MLSCEKPVVTGGGFGPPLSRWEGDGMVLGSARVRMSVGASVDVGGGAEYGPGPEDGKVWDGGGKLWDGKCRSGGEEEA